MTLISTRSLTYLYGKNSPFEIAAIKSVDLDIENGELVGIIGRTGSGKSTLVQHLNGILKPDSGKVFVEGKDIWESKESVREARFKVGLCFQYPEYQLFEETVYKDIAFGPKNMKLAEEEVDQRVRRAADFVGLKRELLDKSPFDLSGGEKRRAAIAGVMAMEPKVLILDEPTAGLDPKGRKRVLSLIRNYREQTGSAVILVSHSMEDIAQMATRVIVLNDSRIAMTGTVDDIFSRDADLVKMGLNVPQITRIFSKLRAGGMNVRADVYTVEQGRTELLRFFGKEGAV